MTKEFPDIVKIIRKFTFLKSKGRYYIGKCPFRIGEELGNTLKVDKEAGQFYCSSCEAEGDVVDFIMKMYDINYIDAINKLNEIAT